MFEEIKNIKSGDTFDYDKAYRECFIDVTEELQRPPIALSIGKHYYKGNEYDNPTFTYGEMSVIIAPQKTKKTFFKTSLISSYIGGQSEQHFGNMNSYNFKNKLVLDFDTEQGTYYAQRAFKRVCDMVGSIPTNYKPYGIKKLTDDERVTFIEKTIEKYKGRIGWVSIDGIADLCENTNDIEKSKKIAQKFMQWTEQGIHLLGVIHKTFEKDRGTGHLGSFMQKKAETVIFLSSTDEKDRNAPVKVTHKNSRGAPFDDFYFELDNNTTLPKLCEEPKW